MSAVEPRFTRADGDSPALTLLTGAAEDEEGAVQRFSGGKAQFTVWGDFGGATATLQYSPDYDHTDPGSATWLDVSSATENGIAIVELLARSDVRAVTVGGAAVALNARLERLLWDYVG